MTMDLWTKLLSEAPTVAVAIFAIWMLGREFRRQQDEAKVTQKQEREAHREERERFVEVIERNTAAWLETTKTMASIAAGMAVVVGAIEADREDVHEIRVLLAQRPCTAGGVVRGDDDRAA